MRAPDLHGYDWLILLDYLFPAELMFPARDSGSITSREPLHAA